MKKLIFKVELKKSAMPTLHEHLREQEEKVFCFTTDERMNCLEEKEKNEEETIQIDGRRENSIQLSWWEG